MSLNLPWQQLLEGEGKEGGREGRERERRRERGREEERDRRREGGRREEGEREKRMNGRMEGGTCIRGRNGMKEVYRKGRNSQGGIHVHVSM